MSERRVIMWIFRSCTGNRAQDPGNRQEYFRLNGNRAQAPGNRQEYFRLNGNRAQASGNRQEYFRLRVLVTEPKFLVTGRNTLD